MASVDDKVKEIIVEQLGVDEGEVTPNASFVDDLGADSLNTVELVMALEEALNLQIPDEDAGKNPHPAEHSGLHQKTRQGRKIAVSKAGESLAF